MLRDRRFSIARERARDSSRRRLARSRSDTVSYTHLVSAIGDLAGVLVREVVGEGEVLAELLEMCIRDREQGGNGIYDNTQGTGWVESWPVHMPHQEVYLALLDQQASVAMADLEKLLNSSDKSAAALQRADAVAKTIESQFYDADKNCYAFSRNADGSQDHTSTVYPALAWWRDVYKRQKVKWS